MMKDHRMCDMVQDLLPTYIDGLTSEGSSGLIREHLDTCDECRRVYRRMTEPGPAEGVPAEAPEIDYLRRTRRRGLRRLAIVGVMAVLAIVAVLAAVFMRTKNLTPEEYVARAAVVRTDGGSSVSIEGTLISAYRYRGCSIAEGEDGVVKVEIKASPAFFYGKDRAFAAEYSLDGPARQVFIGDWLVWEDGEQIPVFISRLYEAKIPYVGDNSGVANLIMDLGIRPALGSCTMSLKTAAEPYGMTVHLSEPLDGSREEAAVQQMRRYACALVALIDNLGEASFEYALDDASGVLHTVTVTENEANTLAAASVKEAAASAAGLMRLMTDLGLMDNYVSVEGTGESSEGVRLDVILSTDGSIDSVEVAVLVEGKVISSGGTIHADETPWQPGETVDLGILPQDFQAAGGIKDGQTFAVQVGLENGGTVVRAEVLELVYRDGAIYETVLTGNEEEGYRLSAR